MKVTLGSFISLFFEVICNVVIHRAIVPVVRVQVRDIRDYINVGCRFVVVRVTCWSI